MKTLTLCAGVLFMLTCNAATSARAPLVGQIVSGQYGGSPLLICQYASSTARFEILSQNGKCAPFLDIQ